MAHAELSLLEQARMVRALEALLAARSGQAPRRMETHSSYVLIDSAVAYKIKKAVTTRFLDYATMALRQWACEEEFRLNRRLAPEMYLDVLRVTGSVDAPRLGGEGAVLDAAVKMKAFEQDDLWSAMAARGALGPEQVDALVAQLVSFHTRAAVAPATGPWGTPRQVRAPLKDTLHDLADLTSSEADRVALARLADWAPRAHAHAAPAMAERLAAGRVRECHGDLHLGNVACMGGQVTMFDGIEYNEAFRWTDVMADVAFMAMDLLAHGLAPLSHRWLNGYLQDSGDHDGLRVLDYYLVERALVRAKVAGLRAAQMAEPESRAAQGDVGRYLRLADGLIQPTRPVLAITHGYSGSGKSALTQGLLEDAGAVRLRSDVERKRIATAADREQLYGEAMTAATQARLADLARRVLNSGRHAIVDATFLRHAHRAALRRVADELGVPFQILHFDADPETLRQRIRQRAARGGDPSDADEQVLARQMRYAEPLQPDEQALCLDVQPLPTPGGAAPQADWAPLLATWARDGRSSRP